MLLLGLVECETGFEDVARRLAVRHSSTISRVSKPSRSFDTASAIRMMFSRESVPRSVHKAIGGRSVDEVARRAVGKVVISLSLSQIPIWLFTDSSRRRELMGKDKEHVGKAKEEKRRQSPEHLQALPLCAGVS